MVSFLIADIKSTGQIENSQSMVYQSQSPSGQINDCTSSLVAFDVILEMQYALEKLWR